MAFLDSLQNIFSAAGAILKEYANNVATVPPPAIENNYSLNRYSNDIKEESPEHQAVVLNKIKEDQTNNMLLAALAGIVAVKILS